MSLSHSLCLYSSAFQINARKKKTRNSFCLFAVPCKDLICMQTHGGWEEGGRFCSVTLLCVAGGKSQHEEPADGPLHPAAVQAYHRLQRERLRTLVVGTQILGQTVNSIRKLIKKLKIISSWLGFALLKLLGLDISFFYLAIGHIGSENWYGSVSAWQLTPYATGLNTGWKIPYPKCLGPEMFQLSLFFFF